MAAAAIVIDQAGKPAGVAGESRQDLDLLTAVTLSNADDTGVRVWRWSLVSKPPSSTAALSVTTGPVSSFTPDIEGSYLLELQVNGGLAGERQRLIAAVLDGNGFRFPAFGEGTEFNADGNADGYGPALDGILRGVATTRTIADWKESCRLATAAALPANSTSGGPGPGKRLIGNANGALTVDGVAVAVGNRILVKNEGTGANNGIYTVTQTGDGSNPYILTRALDFDEDSEVTNGATTSVAAGTANATSIWVLTTLDPIVVDSTVQAWSEIAAATPDHGTLSGLADDDHTQYLLASGARAVAGNLVPDGTGTRDLGSVAVQWRVIYADALSVDGDLTFNGVASTIFLGTTTAGNAQVRFNKGDANNQSSLRWDNAGVVQWLVQHDTSENWNLLDNAAGLVFRLRRADSNIESRGIRAIADSAHDLGTSAVRWAVVYADVVDVGAADGSPTINLNKTAAGTAYVQYRQAVGADTDGDVRAGLDASEQYTIARRIAGSFTSRLYLSSVLGWVAYAPVHANANGNEAAGPTSADDLMVGDPNTGNAGLTIWIGEGVGTINFGIDSTQTSWIEASADTVIVGLEEADALELTHSVLRPFVDLFMDLGSAAQRFQYAFVGTLAPETTSAPLDNTTHNLADIGYIQVNPTTGDVTLNLPASNAANAGKTWMIDVMGTANDIFLDAAGADSVNGNATGNLAPHGQGLYFVTVIGDGTSRCFGPLARPSFT